MFLRDKLRVITYVIVSQKKNAKQSHDVKPSHFTVKIITLKHEISATPWLQNQV